MKSADELAAETAAQLGALERKRVKRMRQRGSDDEESEDDDEDAPKGGYAAKRLKRVKKEDGSARKAPRKPTVRIIWQRCCSACVRAAMADGPCRAPDRTG
jgi:hypothetical protein